MEPRAAVPPSSGSFCSACMMAQARSAWPLDTLVHAQGFDFHIVAGDFTETALEDGDELYWQELRDWNPEAPEGEWRLAWKGDNEDGPYAWFFRPMALRPEAVAPPTQGIDLGPRPMETAPCVGTLLRLLVQFTDHVTEDTEGAAWMIGANNHDHDGEDLWQVAGWCWTRDHFTEGKGTPVGWLPLLDDAHDAAPAAQTCTNCDRTDLQVICQTCAGVAWDNGRLHEFHEIRELSTSLGEGALDGLVPEEWHDKPLLRFQGACDCGDDSAGVPARSGHVLATDQTGTVLGDYLAARAAKGGDQ